MKFKRIGRVLVCLLLVSALLINASPIKAKASAVGATAAITAASTVLSPAGLVVGATFVALGLAAAANPEGFQNMVDAGVSALESAGTWVKDGMVELLRTEDADGNASYYVESGFMEGVRSYAFDSGVVKPSVNNMAYSIEANGYTFSCSVPFNIASFSYVKTGYTTAHRVVAVASQSGYKVSVTDPSGTSKNVSLTYQLDDTNYYYGSVLSTTDAFQYDYRGSYTYPNPSSWQVVAADISRTLVYGLVSDYDLTIGNVPSVPVDGTSARQWSEEYTDRGLKVYGGGSGNNNNDGKWFWKVMIPLTALDLLAMSQADQWSGETPKEFDDYTTKEELEIVSRPEVDFAQGVELAPVTNPEPNPDPDPDPGTTPDVNTDYSSWFSKLYTVVQNIQGKLEEIPNRFQSWITDCKTAIEELPSKFAEWFNNINSKLERLGERLQTIGESIVNGVSTLGEKIVSLGQIIVEGVQNAISSLFTPSPDYFTNKVEALKAKHHNIDKFTQLGNDFKLFFTGLGSKPPIIWIDLGAATGAYLWGGRQIFLDLTWYADYKPKMDAILGAIIWLWLLWRVFLSVPGIINGASGVWGKYHRGGSRDDN